jgi:hypothetical protein
MVSLPEFCVLKQLSSTARRALGARPICPERSVRLTSVPQLNPGVSWTWATSARRRLAGRIATDTGRGPRSSWRCVRAEGRAGNTAPVAGWPWWFAVTWRSPFSVWSAQGVDADEVSLGVGTSTGRRRGRQPGWVWVLRRVEFVEAIASTPQEPAVAAIASCVSAQISPRVRPIAAAGSRG